MKVVINGRFLTQNPTGVQFYAQEICKELEKSIDFEILVPKNQPIINNTLNHKVKKIGQLKGYLWEQFSLPYYIRRQPNCILLNLCNLAPISIKNQVITIHDLAFLKNTNWFSFSFQLAYSYIIPKILKNNKFIVTVSKTVKNEMIRHFNISPEKIHVIYNKVSADLIKAIPRQPLQSFNSKNYYLMVGSLNPRKNFAFVEEQFSKQLTHENLIIVGASHASFKNLNQTNEAKNIIRLKNVSNEELAWLYKNCKALINPSFYEGFGIPNIEAMYFKAPLLCSKIDVFEEVCGNYAYYFELGNASDFIDKITKIDSEKQKTENNRFEYYQSQNRVEMLKKILGS